MIYEIIPTQKLHNIAVEVPGSKSYSNRALIIAGMAEGKSTLKNLLLCDDTLVTINALKALGVKMKQQEKDLEIFGGISKWEKPKEALNLGNAGTAVRFLAAVLTLTSFETVITGDQRMKERPIEDLTDTLNKLGADIHTTNGYLPMTIRGNHLQGGKAEIRGDISSQFISAILIAAPYAQKNTHLEITNEITSASYIDTTVDVMNRFGVQILIKQSGENYEKFQIPSRQRYTAQNYRIPNDASSASYFLALAALHGIKVQINNMDYSFQGDLHMLDILKRMGCSYKYDSSTITLEGTEHLQPLSDVDLNNMPDAAMTVATVAAFCKGESHIKGLGNLRLKECDRLYALHNELNKIGCNTKMEKTGLIINGNPDKLHGATIETYDDHRMAMCFAIVGTKIPGIKIKNPKCVSKTYPLFWKDLEKIGICYREITP